MNDVDFARYANDSNLFFVSDVLLKLQNASKTPFRWFNDNQMKVFLTVKQ